MRRADRLFDVIQTLRAAKVPVTAAMLAVGLEVTVRTVYRDIAALQASRVPIEGAPGIGYVLRRGFDLPPLMFTSDEVDAIAVGARLVRRLRDPQLTHAADRVLAKIDTALPEALRDQLAAEPFYVSDGSAPEMVIDLAEIRRAIRETRKIVLGYRDENGRLTRRTIWPIALAYYVDVTLIGAWCELRQDFRNFRADRIRRADILEDNFPGDQRRLMEEWLALRKDRPNERGLA
jgi:predicted DNA-binding transcriptional regulator YafY